MGVIFDQTYKVLLRLIVSFSLNSHTNRYYEIQHLSLNRFPVAFMHVQSSRFPLLPAEKWDHTGYALCRPEESQIISGILVGWGTHE